MPLCHLGFSRLHPGRAPQGTLAAFARLVRLLRREQPDVLHSFLLHSYLTAAPAGRLARVPVLVAGRRSLGDFKQDRRCCCAWSVWRPGERTCSSRTPALSPRTPGSGRRVPAEKISVVYNGLPDDAFTACPPARIETGHPVLLCVANLKAYKGHQYLLQAGARLRARGRPCTLVLAGEGGERPAA